MGKHLLATAALGLALMAGSPAAAVTTLVDPGCDIFAGCLFTGNDNPPEAVEAAYNAAIDPDIDLDFIVKFEDLAEELSSFDWTSDVLVSFVVVKASDGFMLYQLAAPAYEGTVTNAGLDGHAISHVSLYGGGGVVPEPATWAMMVGGFMGLGAMLRLQRRAFAIA